MSLLIQSAGDGSHLPVLTKIMNLTTGSVLELGMGIFSTPYLHWACYLEKRKLVSYDHNSECVNWFKTFVNDYHEIRFVDNWDNADLSGHWSVALVDHAPTPRRKTEIARLADSADYLVIHDSQPERNGRQKYSQIYPLFKYRKDFGRENPLTTVLSNFQDLTNL